MILAPNNKLFFIQHLVSYHFWLRLSDELKKCSKIYQKYYSVLRLLKADLGVGVTGECERPYLAPLPQAASPGVASLGNPC